MMNVFGIACGTLCAISLSAAAQPCVELVGSASVTAADSDAAGGLIYIASTSFGLSIFDLNNGFSQNFTDDGIGSLDTPGVNHNAVIVSGDRVLIGRAGGLSVVDVSDPTNPTLVSDMDLSNQVTDFDQAPNGTIFASATVINIDPSGERESGVAAYSASGVFIDQVGFDTGSFTTSGVAATDTVVYHARQSDGLWAIPFTDGIFGSPVLIPGTEGARDASVRGDYLYVSIGSAPRGIAVYTGAGTTSLTEVGFVPFDNTPGELAASGDYLIANEFSQPTRVFSIADPANPIQIDTIINGNSAHWSGGLAFAGNRWYDITACTSPCPADTNNDGQLTPADFNAWILAFNNNAPECDQNGDDQCTPADFNAWILNYNAGCP